MVKAEPKINFAVDYFSYGGNGRCMVAMEIEKSNLSEIYKIINKNHFDIDFEVLLYEKDKNGKIKKTHGAEIIKFKFNEFENLVYNHAIVTSKMEFPYSWWHECKILSVNLSDEKHSKITRSDDFSGDVSFSALVDNNKISSFDFFSDIVNMAFKYRMIDVKPTEKEIVNNIYKMKGYNQGKLVSESLSRKIIGYTSTISSEDSGINGSIGFNISEDFIKLRTKDKINNFIKEKIVKPAVEVGIVDRKFQEAKYIDELRQRLLKTLNQDHYFDYGSEKNLQLSLVMMFSDLYSQPILPYGKAIPAYSDSFFSDLWESMLNGFINSIEPVRIYEHESYLGRSMSLKQDI
ncbi:hypothetical protein DN41_3443 [Vibrio cholerae]|nr:hypothetical protein DN41_3443 [Vibrio cholerae]